ncbi:MAG: tyrosine--tRNA ligase [Fimbriimonadia bacterium]
MAPNPRTQTPFLRRVGVKGAARATELDLEGDLRGGKPVGAAGDADTPGRYHLGCRETDLPPHSRSELRRRHRRSLLVTVDEQLEVLRRGAEEIISEEELRAKLERSIATGKPLRAKLGVDPTAPAVTLGWAVVLRKLRQFQDLGHEACLIVGDFTAMIGDPSGKSKTRKQLSREEVQQHVRAVEPQLYKILDPERTRIYYNADWLGKMDFADVIRLASKTTVARILERDDFTNRLREEKPIGLHEILYPLCQGQDSVQIESDVELGGTDQKFNNLVGRNLQREIGQEPQVVLLMPLLVGLDGVEKMSQSLGNYIGITEEPFQMYGKVMSIPDHLIENYFTLATDVPLDEVERLVRGIEQGTEHPMEVKKRLAREITTIYHSQAEALAAEEQWLTQYSKREGPTEVPEADIPAAAIRDGRVSLAALIAGLGLASSNGEARRLIQQGGVQLDGERISDPMATLLPVDLSGKVLKVGKHHYRRMRS